ncbi:MAG: DUF3566 domain-containing protein [Cryobacterium sp.]|nr:DUF3566 domain-containing protein [Cryobacterium sp.]
MSSVAEKLQRKSQKATAVKQVRLKLVYIDFWSAVKLSFLIALSGAIIILAATLMIWVVLNTTGIFDEVGGLIAEILGDETFSLTTTLSLTNVLMYSLIVGALNVIVGTALGAIGALLYNLSVRMTGGLLVGFTNN